MSSYSCIIEFIEYLCKIINNLKTIGPRISNYAFIIFFKVLNN